MDVQAGREMPGDLVCDLLECHPLESGGDEVLSRRITVDD